MSKTVGKKPENTTEQEPVRESPATTAELNAVKSVFEPLLSDCVCRTGQFKNVRRILMEDGRYIPEAIACMTDEERVQNLDDKTLTKFKDELLECTEKEDGTSCTIFYAASKRPDDPFGVCSRNFELKDEPSTYWDVAHELKLPEILAEYCVRNNCNIALQGEITGPGIGCNRDCFESLTFQVFRIWDIDNQCFLTKQERYNVVSDLGLKHVPVLGRRAIKEFCAASGNPDDYNDEPFNPTVARDNILKFSEGKTVRGNEREGVVFKSTDGSFSFKAVSNKYLMGLK